MTWAEVITTSSICEVTRNELTCFSYLQVVDIEGKGRGVVSSKPFKRGDFVVEYEGDLIEMSEAKYREGSYSRCSSIGCYMYYFNFQNKRYWWVFRSCFSFKLSLYWGIYFFKIGLFCGLIGKKFL